MEIHQLRYFCAVAREGSFTRAAEQERVAQPSLSQQILKLESEVGAPLFERLGRTVRLTQCGETLLPQAQAILRQLSDARLSVQGLLHGVRGRLVVGSIPTILPYFLAPRVAGFRREFPDVELQLVENTTPRLVEGLQSGHLDLAVLSLPLSNPDLICCELFRERLLLVLPRDHPLAARKEVDLAEVRDEPLLLLREGHCFRDSALTACRRARMAVRPVFESDQFSSLFALVAGGAGISLVPEMAVCDASQCRVLPLRREVIRRVAYAQVRRQFRLPAQTAFVDWLKQEAKLCGLKIS